MAKAMKQTKNDTVTLPPIPAMHVVVNHITDKGRVLMRGPGNVNLQSREFATNIIEKGQVLLLKEVEIRRATVKLPEEGVTGREIFKHLDTWAQDITCVDYLNADGSELVANATVADDAPPS